jgi:predicted phosphate transport protein (TIGR00153 family)
MRAASPPGSEDLMRLKFIPREKAFFEKFTRGAENLVEGATLLKRMVDDFSDPKASFDAIVDAEHRGDAITHDIINTLNSTFVTPLDREDIHALASGIDDVMDYIEAAADMLILHHVESPTAAVRAQCEVLIRACTAVQECIKRLETFKGLEPFWEQVHLIEKEGDRIFRQSVAELFAGEYKAMEVLKWKEIYDQVEAAIDQCEKIADTLESVVLKNA